MYFFDEIIESRILEAIDRGDFKELPGTGKPLLLDKDPYVPEDMRMAYKILKNAGYIPREIELRNNIAELEKDLERAGNDETRDKTLKKLQCLFMRLDVSRQRQTSLVIQEEYYRKVFDRFSGCDSV